MQLADPSLPRGPSKQLHVDAGSGGRAHAPSQQYCSAWGDGWSRGTAARQGDQTAFLAGVSASRPAPPRRFGRLHQNSDAARILRLSRTQRRPRAQGRVLPPRMTRLCVVPPARGLGTRVRLLRAPRLQFPEHPRVTSGGLRPGVLLGIVVQPVAGHASKAPKRVFVLRCFVFETWSHYMAQDGLELAEMLLIPTSECYD